MVSNVTRAASARVSGIGATVLAVDAQHVYPSAFPTQKVVDLIDAYDAPKNIHSYKTMTDQQKKNAVHRTQQWLQKNPDAVVMIFAPWCGHCHTSMPALASKAGHLNKPCLMINALALEESAIGDGDKSIANVTHFPFWLVNKNSVLSAVDSLDDACNQLTPSADIKSYDTHSADPTITEDALSGENDLTAPFDSLF
jgi:thiol-disulfide isomerase/thioredoxin